MGIQIKKYRAGTLQEAIEQVRNDLGDDAVILQTENVKEAGALLSRTLVEITAAIDRVEPIRFKTIVGESPAERNATSSAASATVTERPAKNQWWNVLLPGGKKPNQILAMGDRQMAAAPKKPVVTAAAPAPKSAASATPESMNQMYAIKTFVEPLQKEIDGLKTKLEKTQAAAQPSALAAPKKKKLFDPLEGEIQHLRSELNNFILEKRYEETDLPTTYRKLVDYWQANGMPSRIILSFLKDIEQRDHEFRDSSAGEVQLAQALETYVKEAPIFDNDGRRIVILVGPTGVGKTTTIAKMAAYEKIKLKRSVCFISLDDFKIGGADQLQSYARILEVPFVRSRADTSLEDLVSLQTADTIYIDTFGVSHRDHEKLDALSKLITFSNPELIDRIQSHLVIPVGVAPRDVKQMLEAFEVLKPQCLLFTKWDETDYWGGMLSTIIEAKKPVSMIGHGQSVPDDLSVFSKKDFIERVTQDLGFNEN